MRIDLIRGDDPAWDEWLNVVPRDVYHTAAYHRFASESGEGEPFLAVVGDRSRGVAWPYLLRRVADVEGLAGSDAMDVGSVYGYAGPLVWGSRLGDPFLSAAWAEVVALWRQQRAVSAFARFHPLLRNEFVVHGSLADLGLGEREANAHHRSIRSEVFGPGRGAVVPEGLTVSLDCTLDDAAATNLYARALRQHINAARRVGLVTEHEDDWAALPTFTRIYRETMVRNDAPFYYHFDEGYFLRLRVALAGRVHLLVTRMGDAVAAAGLFTECGGIAQAHLIATDYALEAPSPSKVLLDDARVWARQRGNTVLHLGGGRGGRHDSLFRFKREFSPRRHLFSTGRWILDPTLYLDLAEAHRSALSSRGPADQSFFPAYRAPLVEPVPSGPPPEPVRSNRQRPSLAADPADRRPADRAQAGLAGEALDVAVRQAPDVGPDHERLERPGPDDRSRVGDDRGHEAGQGVTRLGHRDRDLALGGLDTPRPVPVARARRLGGPRIAGAAQERLELVLDGPLENQPGAQATELTEPVGVLEPSQQSGLDRGLDLDAGSYSSIHGVVSFANFLGPLWSLRRLHFYSGLRTPPGSSRPPQLSHSGSDCLVRVPTRLRCPALPAVIIAAWAPGAARTGHVCRCYGCIVN